MIRQVLEGRLNYLLSAYFSIVPTGLSASANRQPSDDHEYTVPALGYFQLPLWGKEAIPDSKQHHWFKFPPEGNAAIEGRRGEVGKGPPPTPRRPVMVPFRTL